MKESAREENLRLPVKLDTATNGEYWPKPLSSEIQQVNRWSMEAAERNARLVGISRRDYLRTTCGAATVFLALNQLGCSGGRYNLRRDADRDQAAADEVLRGNEFIFDVQTHEVTTDRAWLEVERPHVGDFLKQVAQAKCGAPSWVDCFTEDVLIREVFLDSDTQFGVLSALWGEPHPTPIDLAAHTRERAVTDVSDLRPADPPGDAEPAAPQRRAPGLRGNDGYRASGASSRAGMTRRCGLKRLHCGHEDRWHPGVQGAAEPVPQGSPGRDHHPGHGSGSRRCRGSASRDNHGQLESRGDSLPTGRRRGPGPASQAEARGFPATMGGFQRARLAQRYCAGTAGRGQRGVTG